MAGVRENSIFHFTHPPHPLAKLCSEKAEYLCNGCHTLGLGTRYCCQSCNFNLHDYCASCPASLSSSMHPHPLALVSRNPHHERFCNLCGSHVQGIFYSCKLCDFDLHPICTQLPELLLHVLDPDHPLSLQQPSSVPACCAVCGAPRAPALPGTTAVGFVVFMSILTAFWHRVVYPPDTAPFHHHNHNHNHPLMAPLLIMAMGFFLHILLTATTA